MGVGGAYKLDYTLHWPQILVPIMFAQLRTDIQIRIKDSLTLPICIPSDLKIALHIALLLQLCRERKKILLREIEKSIRVIRVIESILGFSKKPTSLQE